MTKKAKIIVIEDEKPLAQAMELKLKNSGYLVDVVYNGRDGLELIKTNDYSVALLDLMMPVMDGFQVLKSLKELKSPLPVIVLSNLTQPEDMNRVMDLGASKFLVKSDTPLKDLIAEIQLLVD